ncbi:MULTISPECIES: hypothetical protein [unclassified Microcoleus]|uniref:hypothetical protein n=1 Tax=unclassified Microcoleus TaxID=2642155 RepID=UPI002FD1FC76
MRKNDKFYYAEAVRAWLSGISRSPDPSVSGLPNASEATLLLPVTQQQKCMA